MDDNSIEKEIQSNGKQLPGDTGPVTMSKQLAPHQQHIDELEDLYLAEQRLIDVRAGRSTTHSIDDVERRLGLAD